MPNSPDSGDAVVKRFGLILGVILFSNLFWDLLPVGDSMTKVSGKTQTSANNFDQAILQSSLQILVYPEDGVTRERGIGTLISMASQDLIVTHNHWDLLGELGKVEILDAKDNLLVEISAMDFKVLVRYSDRGNLIFAAPPGLQASLASLGNPQDLRVGDVITVVHQASGSQAPLDLMPAEIRAIEHYNGLPIFRFVSVDGQEIKPGDSGGGVWYEGQLIGNTWGMYFQEDNWFVPGSGEVQISNVAQLPIHFLELVQASRPSFQVEEDSRRLDHLKRDLP